MPILEGSTQDEISRLLSLFPVAVLKEEWEGIKGTKEVICDTVARALEPGKAIDFILANFAKCKMHVYVLDPSQHKDVSIMNAITDAEILKVVADGPTLILARVSFVVILQDSLKKEKVDLLWPMRIHTLADHLVLSAIVLERTPATLYNEPISIVSRSLDEKLIVKNLKALGFDTADVHKGMKALWEEDYMDAFNVRFRSPDSTLTEVMDEEKGIKATKPERYEELKTATMFMSAFHLLKDPVKSIGDFFLDPSRGHFRFPRYTDDSGDADAVVQALLSKN
ncbi:hypothetical protein [Granulicella mallensis]|uniref:PII-like signaling protein n=1 Tax=Granulicella mallensis TaxID=940614 RepID=A0A7W7ZM50_9BACT|nr:hypothetical protein [Granulicella mallensis]MBB5062455.1 PII-like signaling protein [Granulicella mallensis]